MTKKLVRKNEYWTPFPLAPFPGAKESHITRRVFWLKFPRWKHSYRVRRAIARPSDRKRLNQAWENFRKISSEPFYGVGNLSAYSEE